VNDYEDGEASIQKYTHTLAANVILEVISKQSRNIWRQQQGIYSIY